MLAEVSVGFYLFATSATRDNVRMRAKPASTAEELREVRDLPPTTMIGTRPTVTIACPRPDYEALKREDEAYTRTLTSLQRLMRPRPFWRRLED